MGNSMEETGMRIDSNQGAQALSGATQNTSPATATEAARAANAEAVVGEDQAQFSGAHVQVQALAAQVAQMPEINQAKVDALRQSVLDGTYEPNAGDIADALLSDMVEPIAA
jgi:flagellar biosynthesis anti-sigma factor FlgM